jgi:hypothetical protein
MPPYEAKADLKNYRSTCMELQATWFDDRQVLELSINKNAIDSLPISIFSHLCEIDFDVDFPIENTSIKAFIESINLKTQYTSSPSWVVYQSEIHLSYTTKNGNLSKFIKLSDSGSSIDINHNLVNAKDDRINRIYVGFSIWRLGTDKINQESIPSITIRTIGLKKN